MAYKEPKLDKEGAKALYEALTKMNDEITSGKNKKKKKKQTEKDSK